MKYMKQLIAFLMMAFLGFSGTVSAQTEAPRKVLVIYYSWGGNTRHVVSEIEKLIAADRYEIELVNPYPTEYNACGEQAKKDLDNQARPAIKGKLPDMKQYDTILIGYPIWCGMFPMVIPSLLEKVDLKGKRVIPFCTHGGGGSYNSFTELRKHCVGATFGKGLSIHGKGGSSLHASLRQWLSDNTLINK